MPTTEINVALSRGPRRTSHKGDAVVVLTDKERLIWRELRARATSGNAEAPTPACLRYSELGRLVDPDRTWHYPMSRPPFRGLNDALGHVSQYEYEPNRPLLSALVVTAETDRPGAGFSQFAIRTCSGGKN
jgi:hypothetical protein